MDNPTKTVSVQEKFWVSLINQRVITVPTTSMLTVAKYSVTVTGWTNFAVKTKDINHCFVYHSELCVRWVLWQPIERVLNPQIEGNNEGFIHSTISVRLCDWMVQYRGDASRIVTTRSLYYGSACSLGWC